MSTKQILVLTILIVVAGATSAYFILKPKNIAQTENLVTSVNPATAGPTSIPVALLTWQDEAGFSFQYPQGTTIDKHPEDNQNYANLSLIFPDKTTAQIIMSDKTPTNVTSATFTDNDVIVTITGNKDLIVKSWQFIYPTPTTGKSATSPISTDSGDVLEEE